MPQDWLNFNYEKDLFKQGFKNIAGVDEAGRGSWAGPIVAGAVIINSKLKDLYFNAISKKNFKFKIKDSKHLTLEQRERLFELITAKNIWAVGVISEKIIDQIGVGRANVLAMRQAVENLKIQPDFVLFDGILKIAKIKISHRSIVKGDEKTLACACASVVAKVYRDRLMSKEAHLKYPRYKFDRHKGYGTSKHLAMIKKYGICPLHRKSFKPIKDFNEL